MVVLTWNEARNIRGCLDSLRNQEDKDFELIVLDAGSSDGTPELIRQAVADFPVPVIFEAAGWQMPIGEARNRGVLLAQAPIIAFLSADAEAHPGWTRQIGLSMRESDMVFGRQVHEPHQWTTAAAVRGLRYHFPVGPTKDPIRFASNVSAAFRREILEANPFEPGTNAAEDTLLARRAGKQGFRATYDPAMVVRHHDVSTTRQEARKNLREGRASGRYASEIGIIWPFVAWGALLVGAAGLAVLRPRVGITALAVSLWLPAIRRAVRPGQKMPWPQRIRGVAASPPFDLMFLVNYVRGLAKRATPPPVVADLKIQSTQETPA